MARPQLPDVQVGDAVVGVRLDGARDRGPGIVVGGGVEQDVAAVAQQAPGPARDHRRAEHPDHRVQPGPARVLARDQRHDREQRGERVREHVEVGRAQVVVRVNVAVVVVMVMVMVMVIVVIVVVVVAVIVRVVMVVQHGTAHQVHREAGHGDADGLVVVDRQRVDQPHQRFERHHEGDHRQRDRAGKAAEHADLAGAVAVARIRGVDAGVAVGEQRDAEGGDVRRHVPAVGQQRHRAAGHAGHDLDQHHHRGQRDDAPRAGLGAAGVAAEVMAVTPAVDVVVVHAGASVGPGSSRAF